MVGKSLIYYSGDISSRLPNPKLDTVPVIMLLADTTRFDEPNNFNKGGQVFWGKGHIVQECHYTGNITYYNYMTNPSYDYYTIIKGYLDDNKRPLKSYYIVFLANKIRKNN